MTPTPTKFQMFRDASAIVDLYLVGGNYTARNVPLVAHEMGHVLGAEEHDGEYESSKCNTGTYIMAPNVDGSTKTWSSCSR